MYFNHLEKNVYILRSNENSTGFNKPMPIFIVINIISRGSPNIICYTLILMYIFR